MNGRELRDLLNKIPEEYLDADIDIDVEARCFNYHYVNVESISLQEVEGKPTIILFPDYSDSGLNVYTSANGFPDLDNIEDELKLNGKFYPKEIIKKAYEEFYKKHKKKKDL